MGSSSTTPQVKFALALVALFSSVEAFAPPQAQTQSQSQIHRATTYTHTRLYVGGSNKWQLPFTTVEDKEIAQAKNTLADETAASPLANAFTSFFPQSDSAVTSNESESQSESPMGDLVVDLMSAEGEAPSTDSSSNNSVVGPIIGATAVALAVAASATGVM